MTFRLPPVLSFEDLPATELYAAKLDGELVAVDNYFFPIDEPDGLRHRARLLAAMAPRRMIAEQHSAAWVWGVRDLPPLRHQFCVDVGARVCIAAAAPHRLREVVINEADVASIGRLRLTTLLRTAVDIARARGPFDPNDCDVIAALMTLGSFGEYECVRVMNTRRNLPRKKEAITRLRDAEERASLR